MKSEVVSTFFTLLLFGFSRKTVSQSWLPGSTDIYPIFKGVAPENVNIERGFQMLTILDRTLYIGAKDCVYAIDLDVPHKRTLFYSNRLELKPTGRAVHECKRRLKSKELCYNSIKIILKKDNGTLFICGTNAFSPSCRNYKIKCLIPEGGIIDGRGKCPYSPKDGNIALFSGGNLYSATVANYYGSDWLIYRSLGDLPNLRTFRYDSRWLNEPFFIHGIDRGQYIYFFFREVSVEYYGMEKVIVSRVARLCKNDMGGRAAFLQKVWTSFLKARLTCAIPGALLFDIYLLQSVTDVVQIHGQDVVFAIFSTLSARTRGSAICAFAMDDIEKVFAGRFKEQRSPTSFWTPVPDANVPTPRPGSCVGSEGLEGYASSKDLPSDTLEFLRKHTLMDESVQPISQRPLFLERTSRNFILKIIADTTAGPKGDHTVLFVGTSENIIYKLLVIKDDSGFMKDTFFLEKLFLFFFQGCQKEMHRQFVDFKLDKPNGVIYIAFTGCVIRLPLGSCQRHGPCKNACIASRDPYCGWVNEKCVYLPPGTTTEYEQDLRSDGINDQECYSKEKTITLRQCFSTSAISRCVDSNFRNAG